MPQKPFDRAPAASEFATMRQFLADRGLTPAQIRQVMGQNASDKSRQMIGQGMRQILKTTPAVRNK